MALLQGFGRKKRPQRIFTPSRSFLLRKQQGSGEPARIFNA